MPEIDDEEDEGEIIRVLVQPHRESNFHSNDLKEISIKSNTNQFNHQVSKFSCFQPDTQKMNSLCEEVTVKRNNTTNNAKVGQAVSIKEDQLDSEEKSYEYSEEEDDQ